ncbi:FAD-binding oxidoreductase [Helicobacter pametensis]|uniref:FAD-binding oxidoreductase n=1 Tax=Helicobacter pametensis TaxID=95149 RepID=UPI00048A343B|nr:FAD-linked oxidase C-terminal domain-containing protein [Helicobacter pametensis]
MKHFSCLEEIVGVGGVYCDEAHLSVYGFDSTRLEKRPSYVVFPQNENQIAQILSYANAHLIPVTPRGAGSGMSGGCINEGIILAMQKYFSSIIHIDLENLCVTLQPGVINGYLNKILEPHHLFFPPDPASSAFSSVGGNIAENAGGMNAVRYGVSKNHILSMRVVLGSGEILQLGHKTYKDVAGYDLVGLMCGSEGTLGVITEMTLKLAPKPKHITSVLICFDGIKALAEASCAILASGLSPYAMEFLDSLMVAALNHKYQIYPEQAKAVLIIKLMANHLDSLERDVLELREIAARFSPLLFMRAQNQDEEERIWFGRKNASQASNFYGVKKLNEDITVPRGSVAKFLHRVEKISQKYGLTIACFGHIGDGNIHTNVMLKNESELDVGKQAVRELFAQAIEMGGTLSGEHGIGLSKSSFMPMAFGDLEMRIFREIKKVFDPNGILNPHKMGL